MVTDVAIGGNENDMASGRGQIGDAKEMPNLDFNTLTTPGNYRITGNPTNGPSLPLNISGASIGSLIVAGTLGQNGRIFQIMISGSTVTWRTILDTTGTTWSDWQQLLSGNKVGDGIRTTQGIISVPEYEGATASAAGTSGLVPPAAAGQHESFLTGGGEYKPALTKISDSVALANSTTAASAKAVKTAYDRGSAGIAAAGEAKGTADRALNAANTAQSSADGALAAANDAQKTANAKVGFYGANSINIGYQNGMAYYNVNETDIKKIAPYETGYATARAAQGNAVYVPSGGTWYFEAIMFRIDVCTVAEQAWFAMNQSFCSVVAGGTKIIDTTATTGCLAFCKKIL